MDISANKGMLFFSWREISNLCVEATVYIQGLESATILVLGLQIRLWAFLLYLATGSATVWIWE